MKIRKEDTVLIIAGKDKGKKGKVLQVIKDKDMVLVEGVNIVKKHLKPGVVNDEGGIISIEKPLHVSNVMFIDSKKSKPTKLAYKVEGGKKYRVSKKTGEII